MNSFNINKIIKINKTTTVVDMEEIHKTKFKIINEKKI